MLETAFKIVAGGLFTVLGLLWKASDSRLTKVEDCKLEKDLFEAVITPMKEDLTDIKTSNSDMLQQIADRDRALSDQLHGIDLNLATIAKNGNDR